MDAQGICRDLLTQVEGGLGCIVIDMRTGLTVAAELRSGTVLDSEGINLVSIVATNMFSGKLIREFERTLGRTSNSRFVREAHMTTDNVNHFMAVIPGWEDGLLVLVTDAAVSVGLGWMAIHRFVGRFADAPRPTEAVVPPRSYEWHDEPEPATPRPAVAPPQPAHQPNALASAPATHGTWNPAPPIVEPRPAGGVPPQAQPVAVVEMPEEIVHHPSPPTAARPNEAAPRVPRGARMNMFASRRDKERK